MADNLGNGVSFVYDDNEYNYNMIVYQKGKPPLDTEHNAVQEIQDIINQRQMNFLSSGWLSMYPFYTDKSVDNTFYTQNTSNPKPEFALVNGNVIYVTNTKTETDNLNLIDLGDPPTSGNRINGVFLEVWKALLDPDTITNRPEPETIIDTLESVFMDNANRGWICGQNGLVLITENGGQTWNVKTTNTEQTLNDIFFITSNIGWTVGNSGTILRSSSQGERWTELESPTAENLKSVTAASQLVAWAVGDTGTILKTTNAITWTALSSGVSTNLRKIHFRDKLTGWVVGENGLIMKTTNGGTTWNQVTSGTTENLNSIYFYDLSYGFAVGENGTILQSSNGGSSWVNQSGKIWKSGAYTSISENLNDIHMVPGLDIYVTNEEVSHYFDGATKSCTLAHSPVTKGDGKGTTTNDPSYVTVRINGSEVTVDTLNGSTGTITLTNAPNVHDTVLVSYYYRSDCEVFEGKAWIVGDSGTVLMTNNLGAKWNPQTNGISSDVDFNGVYFVDNSKGWTVGIETLIKNTQNGGQTWNTQQSDVSTREIQRVYKEGNVDTYVFLDDNSIHQDANVETTKRVQTQYRIRIISGADPQSYPEAGLSSSVLGQGPNDEGLYSYENMGMINGDYGCWRAKCLNTIDGYVYAIPMFFVNRRNTGSYNAQTNANGEYKPGTAIRPDLLTATQIDESDILDVRRKIRNSSFEGYLRRIFNLLSDNKLKTKFQRASVGGDRYGTEILIIDRVAGLSSDGGQLINNASLLEAINGDISSEASLVIDTKDITASTTLPTEITLKTLTNGIYHPNPAYYKAFYDSGSGFDGRAIPGYFEGFGTNQVKFIFKSFANTTNDDTDLKNYKIIAAHIEYSSLGLRHVPATPALVKNTSGLGNPAFYYHGVLDSDTYKTIETWASGISGYNNYAVVYPAKDSTDDDQQKRGSTVQVHYFMQISDSVKDVSGNLIVPRSIEVVSSGVPYSIYTISKINNLTAGFSYKIDNLEIDTDNIKIESGYEFVNDTIVEIVGHVTSSIGDTNVRNGASVNFTQGTKKISKFFKSEIITSTYDESPKTISLPKNSLFTGISASEINSPNILEPIIWVNGEIWRNDDDEHKITVTGYGTNDVEIEINDLTVNSQTIKMQVLVQETEFTNNKDENDNDGLLIGYTYIPYQTISDLPNTIKAQISAQSPYIYVSNLGTAGGVAGYPYSNPIEHIPIGDLSLSDKQFSNKIPLKFKNFDIDTGIAQMPFYIPADLGDEIELSTVSEDADGRFFYATSSKEFEVATEGLQISTLRKVFLPIIAQIKESSDNKLMVGEYVMIIFSRTLNNETENTTGFALNGSDVVAVYRLPNKPIDRI